jgi:hypothetical protein
LFRKIAWRIQALEEGGLSESTGRSRMLDDRAGLASESSALTSSAAVTG